MEYGILNIEPMAFADDPPAGKKGRYDRWNEWNIGESEGMDGEKLY